MKKRGFTLIELLAVIVILAIIALIAVPIVLNIINNSKESAKLRSAELYIDAVNNALAQYQLGNKEIPNGTYEIMSDGNICLGTIIDGVCDNTLEVSVDGEIPDSGSITIENNKKVSAELYYGTDKIVKDDTGNLLYQEDMAPGLYDAKGNLLANWDELVNDYNIYLEKSYQGYMAGTKPNEIIEKRFPNATKLVISEDISVIGWGALSGCNSLVEIIIPNSVTSIRDYVFSSCSSLNKITIGAGLKSIGKYTFSNCSNLEIIEVDENNPVYDSRDNSNAIIKTSTNEIVAGCKNTVIPNSVTKIGYKAFENCTSLTNINIPNSVTSIGNQAFRNCTNLISIKIPNSVTSIGNYAFAGCSSLLDIIIPNNVKSIPTLAFSGCSSLKSITISSSVRSIDNSAFQNCANLETIVVDSNNTVYDSRDNSNAIIQTSTNELVLGCKNTVIPSDVKTIGQRAFSGCIGLTSVTIPNSVTSIQYAAFGGCSNLKSIEIPNSVTVIGQSAFSGCSSLTSIEIPNSVTDIEWGAFSSCTGLTSIEIPASVISIESSIFYKCNGLETIIVDENNTVYDSKDNSNAIIETATNTLIAGCKNTKIPSSVTSIAQYAFESCETLTNIEIPTSVTSIGKGAFSYSGLTSVTIPSNVVSIGEEAFSYCKNLVTVYFEHETAPTFSADCFKKLSGDPTTFYFKNSTVASALNQNHYYYVYGTKSTDYSW